MRYGLQTRGHDTTADERHDRGFQPAKIKNEHKYEWKRFYYENVWWFGGKGTSLNKGYENANDVQIIIPYELNKDLKYENFGIGDILVKGKLIKDIKSEIIIN